MKKRIASLLLALVLALSLLPTTALAADNAATSVTVGGVELNAAAPYWKNGDTTAATGTAGDWNAHFDAENGVLTLKDAVITGADDDGSNNCGIFATASLTLVLTGSSTVTGGAATEPNTSSYGINVRYGALTVKGGGALTVSGGTATTNSCGVYANWAIYISGSAAVTAISGAGISSCGISAGRDICISESAAVTAIGGTAGRVSRGVCAYGGDIAVKDSASLTAIGGAATGGGSYGVQALDEMTVSDSAAVTATGGKAVSGNSYGIASDSDVSVSTDAAVTAIGGAGDASTGIYSSGTLDCSSGKITAIGGAATRANSYGMCLSDAISLSGDVEVTAVGGSAVAATSYGVLGDDGVTVGSGSDAPKLVAVGGDGAASYGVATYSATVPITYHSGLLVAKGGKATTSQATSDAPTVADSDAAEVTGTADGSGSYYVVSPKTGGTADYAVFEGNVTSATTDVGGHLEWSDVDEDGTKETLTLTNTVIIGADSANDTMALTVPAGGTLTVTGFNVVLAGASSGTGGESTNNSYAIYGAGALSVTGGVITAVGSNANLHSLGIDSEDALSVTGSVITAVGGNANSSSYGIYGYVGCTLSNSTVTAVGGSAGDSYGICGYDALTIKDSSTVTAVGGNAGGDSSYGIDSLGVLSVTGSVITAVGRNAGRDSYGIHSRGASVTGGTVTAVGGNAESDDSYGICDDGALTVEDGSVITAMSGNAAINSFGVFSNNACSISNSTVTAVCGNAGNKSCGISSSKECTISNSAVTAVSGNATNGSSYGVYSGGTLSVKDSSAVTAIGGNAATGNSYGVYSEGTLSVKDSSTVTAVSGNADYNSFGVFSKDNCEISNSAVTAVGGTAAGGFFSVGLYIPGESEESTTTITITGSTVLARGGSSARYSYGIFSSGNCTISSSAVKAIGGNALGGNSFGVCSSWQQVVLTDSAVTAVSGSAKWNSYGIFGSDNCSISNSVVKIIGGNAQEGSSCGISSNGSCTISGGAGTAAGNTVAFNKEPAFSNVVVTDGSFTGQSVSWRAATHTVTFENQNGAAPTKVPVADNTAVARPANPVRTGYTFGGWYKDAACTNAWNFATQVIEDVTLYAKWTRQSGDVSGSAYTVTVVVGEGGSVSPSGAVSVPRGQDKTFAITPDDGYVIGEVLLDGASVKNKLTGNSYTLANVQKAHTLKVTFIEKSKANPFTDVKDSDWFFEDVLFVYENVLMNGTSATTFKPGRTTTRGMIAAILYRMAGSPAIEDKIWGYPFADVNAEAYYGTAVYWARLNGIVGGYDAEHFGPERPITREQLATILYRYAKYKGYDVSAAADITRFSDSGTVGAYAADAMRWACGSGLIRGSGGKLTPKGSATRAQVAAILHRFCENIAK